MQKSTLGWKQIARYFRVQSNFFLFIVLVSRYFLCLSRWFLSGFFLFYYAVRIFLLTSFANETIVALWLLSQSIKYEEKKKYSRFANKLIQNDKRFNYFLVSLLLLVPIMMTIKKGWIIPFVITFQFLFISDQTLAVNIHVDLV